jgi:hypothetical protein
MRSSSVIASALRAYAGLVGRVSSETVSNEFGKGVLLGVAIAAVAVTTLLAIEFRDLLGMYADFGSAKLPVLTRATLSVVWLVGAPLAGAAACTVLAVRRPRPLVPYVVVAVLGVAAAVITWYGPRLPIFELAGTIKAD